MRVRKVWRRFVTRTEKSKRFWAVRLRGKELDLQYGREGTTGRKQSKSFPTLAKARAAYDKAVRDTCMSYSEIPIVRAKTGTAAGARETFKLGGERFRPLGVRGRRGFQFLEPEAGSPNTMSVTMVRADIDSVTELGQRYTEGEIDREASIPKLRKLYDSRRPGSVLQYRGHEWTIFFSLELPRAVTKALSHALQTSCLSWYTEDTSGWCVFTAFDKGRRVEEYSYGYDTGLSDIVVPEEPAVDRNLGQLLRFFQTMQEPNRAGGDYTRARDDDMIYEFRSTLRTLSEDQIRRPVDTLDRLYTAHDAWLPSPAELPPPDGYDEGLVETGQVRVDVWPDDPLAILSKGSPNLALDLVRKAVEDSGERERLLAEQGDAFSSLIEEGQSLLGEEDEEILGAFMSWASRCFAQLTMVDVLLSRGEHADALRERLDTATEETETTELAALLRPAIESGIGYLETVSAEVLEARSNSTNPAASRFDEAL